MKKNEHVELAQQYLRLALSDLEPVLDDSNQHTLARKYLTGVRNAIENANTVLGRIDNDEPDEFVRMEKTHR